MKRKEPLKFHKVLIDTIELFRKPKSGTLISNEEIFNGKKAKFKPYKNEFTINFRYDAFLKKQKTFGCW